MTFESHSQASVRTWVVSALAILIALSVWIAAAAAPESSAGSEDAPAENNPNDLPVASCFWTGPFTHSNPKTNLAYPGTEITYWGAKFVTPPGAVLKLDGRFPYARYSSFNAYRDNGVSASSLSDTKIEPNAGSINPSIPGRDRLAKNRSFTIEVRGEAKPAVPAPNTLYAEPVAGKYQDILYRVYIPDKGKSLDGGTGLPEPSLELEDGTTLTGQALCDALDSSHDYTNQLLPLNVYNLLLQGKGPEFVATNPAMPEFRFARYFNLPTSLARYGTENDQEIAWANNPDYVGTQYDNGDARYMTGSFATDFGQTMALHGRLPTTPTTWNGNKRTKAGQLVEWDMCVIQSLVTTKTWKCVFDEQLPLRGKKRNYVILVSKKAERPKNARQKCGVYWLEADPEGDGAGRPNVGQLLTRNILPAKDFNRSSWSVPTPFPEDAAETMGEYYPRGTYMSKRKFEAGGCPFKWKR